MVVIRRSLEHPWPSLLDRELTSFCNLELNLHRVIFSVEIAKTSVDASQPFAQLGKMLVTQKWPAVSGFAYNVVTIVRPPTEQYFLR